MSTLIVFRQMLVIMLLIAVGYGFYKKRWITDAGSRSISFLVVNVTNPAVAISSAFSEQAEISHEDLLLALLVACIIYAVLILLGKLLPVLIGVKKPQRRFYEMLCVYSNVGFMGIPLVSAILGTEAVLYVTLMIIVFNILFYTHGYACMLSGTEGLSWHVSWKSFLNAGTVSGVIAILLFWFGFHLPAVVEETITYAGRATTFLAMVVLGVSLAKRSVRSILKEKRLILFWAIRYLAFPILAALVISSALSGSLMGTTFAILMAMPAANMPLMLAEQYGLETDILSAGAFLTTVTSILTVTMVTLFI